MDLADVRRLTCSQPSVLGLLARTHFSSITARIAPDPLSIMSPERVESLRPSRPGVRLRCPRLARLLGLALLVGLSACGSPAPEAPVAGSTSGTAAAVGSRSVGAAPAETEQAQREARQQWVAALRESPDAPVRLHALNLWAQEPGDDLEPLFEALGDDDEAVQAQAEELWEQQLAQEEGASEETEG